MGILTDFFAVATAFSFPSCPQVFYVSEFVCDANDYILAILLVFCRDKLTPERLMSLRQGIRVKTKRKDKNVLTTTKKPRVSTEYKAAASSSENRQASHSSKKREGSKSSGGQSRGSVLAGCGMLQRMLIEEQKRNVYEWFANKENCIPLTIENLKCIYSD